MRRTRRLLAAGLLSAPPAVGQSPPAERAAAGTSTPGAAILPPVIAAEAKSFPPSGTAFPGAAVEALFGPTYPIDLPTALRLANAASPTIAIADARVREA